MEHGLDQRRSIRPSDTAPGVSLTGPRHASLTTLSQTLNAAPTVQRVAEQAPANRTGLSDGLKAGIEALSGMSMGHVRVHYNSAEPAQLHAHAFTQGSDIHVAPGQEQHVAHEAWHVVQQAQGRVRATQRKGEHPINDETSLEQEADVMGAKAAQLKANGGAHGAECCCGSCGAGAAQRKAVETAPADDAAAQLKAIANGPIQRCVHCGDNSCIKGEKCGYDRTHGGLFDPSTSNAPAVLPYNSSNAKKQSGKTVGRELEHVIPGASLRLTGEGGGYRQEYVLPISKEVHRNGVSGGGGGITSTGSSSTAKGWAQHLSQMNDYDRVRESLNDEINAHIMNQAFTHQAMTGMSDWLQAQCEQEGRISQGQLVTLRTLLLNRFHDQR